MVGAPQQHVAAPPPPADAQNIFPAGMLGFSSFRGTVLVASPERVLAFSTGRHAGGDVSARNVVVRTSAHGGKAGTWTPPKIIANLSASSLAAGDGLYLGTGTYDPATQEALLFWGECLERCHPGQSGAHVMEAPTFWLTVSKDDFKTRSHINLTALATRYSPDPQTFLPYNFFDNAAVIAPAQPLSPSTGLMNQRHPVTSSGGWPASGLVLVGSVHNSNSSDPSKHNCSECPICCRRTGSVTYHSSDHGRTFARGVQLTPPPTPLLSEYVMIDEPQLGRLPNGTYIMVGHGDAKSSGRNTLSMATSTDHGRSFGNLHKVPGLVQPGCGLGLLVDGATIYISHDNNGTLASAGPNAHDASRNNLTISHSLNDGESWHSRPVDHRFTGLSMLAIVPAAAGTRALGVLYEAGHKRFDGDGVWFRTMPLV